MKQYFKLESSNYVDYGVQKSPKLGEQSVMGGRRVDRTQLPPLEFEHDFPQDEPIPHYLTGGTVLASERFLDLLDRIGVDNYQAFPARLENPETGERREDYSLFNVLGLREAADLDASTYDEIMGANPEGVDLPLNAFTDLAIDADKVGDVDMFRLAEEPVTVVVSDLVVDGLKNETPDGGWGVVIEEVDVV